MNSGYLPAGAANDPDAPYNERTIREKRLVTVTFCYEEEAEIIEGADEKDIKEEFRRVFMRNGVPGDAQILDFEVE